MPRAAQEFVVLASQRTGSNMLRSLLASHPDVVPYAEIFLPEHSWFEDNRGPADSPALIAERDADPVAFVEKYVFRDYESQVGAVGFKLFYNQASHDDWRLWKWLNDRSEVKVIHLRRANLFRQFVSMQVAVATNVWRSNYTKLAKMPHEEVVLEVEPNTCEGFMQSMSREAEEAVARLAKLRRLDLTYEEMTDDLDATLERVLEFLEIPNRPLMTPLKKQVNRSLRDLIRNYGELKQRFAPTRWASCFDE